MSVSPWGLNIWDPTGEFGPRNYADAVDGGHDALLKSLGLGKGATVTKSPGDVSTDMREKWATTDPFDFASKVNPFMAKQAKDQYVNNITNYTDLESKRSKIASDQLDGKLSDDVIDQLINSAAERGILTGSPGSSNSNAAYLRALGLTSLDLQTKGFANVSTIIKDAPVAEIFNPASMIIPGAMGQWGLDVYNKGLEPKKVGPGTKIFPSTSWSPSFTPFKV